MKKFISILLCAVMLSVYFTVFSVPAMALTGTDVQEMVNQADPNDTINIVNDYYKRVIITMDQIVTISQPCTINFKNYSFRQSGGPGRYFYIASSGVTLNFEDCDFTVTTPIAEKGAFIYVSENGYACKIYGSGDTVFSGKTDDEDGGAIYLNAEDCRVKGIEFKDCSGADGGAICINKDGCVIQSCKFSNCEASSDGGAIYVCWNTDGVRINDCKFEKCTCKGDGQYVHGDGNDPEDEESTWVTECSGEFGDPYYYYDCVFKDFSGTGFTLSGGNTWIVVVAGAVVIIGGLAAILVANKKKNANV